MRYLPEIVKADYPTAGYEYSLGVIDGDRERAIVFGIPIPEVPARVKVFECACIAHARIAYQVGRIGQDEINGRVRDGRKEFRAARVLESDLCRDK